MENVFLWLVLIGLGCGFVRIMSRMRKEAVACEQDLVEAAFEERVSKHPILATAKLVRKKDEIRGDQAVSVQTNRIYRCADGSYWLFICTSSHPGYLTQLSLERTKSALRSTPEILVKEFPGTT